MSDTITAKRILAYREIFTNGEIESIVDAVRKVEHVHGRHARIVRTGESELRVEWRGLESNFDAVFPVPAAGIAEVLVAHDIKQPEPTKEPTTTPRTVGGWMPIEVAIGDGCLRATLMRAEGSDGREVHRMLTEALRASSNDVEVDFDHDETGRLRGTTVRARKGAKR